MEMDWKTMGIEDRNELEADFFIAAPARMLMILSSPTPAAPP